MVYSKNTTGDFFSEGESQIYVGKLYLILIAKQMARILMSELDATVYKGDRILVWLTDLKLFYDLIDNQLKLRNSDKEIDFQQYKLVNNRLEKVDIKLKEKEKFEFWFSEIELMYERNQKIENVDHNRIVKYTNDKKILLELSKCTRELYHEANKRHLIMPDVKMDMKELAKNDWIDRGESKELYP